MTGYGCVQSVAIRVLVVFQVLVACGILAQSQTVINGACIDGPSTFTYTVDNTGLHFADVGHVNVTWQGPASCQPIYFMFGNWPQNFDLSFWDYQDQSGAHTPPILLTGQSLYISACAGSNFPCTSSAELGVEYQYEQGGATSWDLYAQIPTNANPTCPTGGFCPYYLFTFSLLTDNTPDLGSASKSGCEGVCGSPINLTNGNVYVQQQDYSLPGMAGGIQLSRTWNSLWAINTPWESSGMFGDSWQSGYEAHIQVTQSGAKFWRGDGSAWTFTYNPTSQTYSLTSPPDERATLTFSTSTTHFTLTLADGTQQVFSQPGYLLALLDRNGNQTTLGYDGSNRLTSVTDAASRILTFSYGNSSLPGQATSIQDTTGTVATYAYDNSGHLATVTYADGSVIHYTSDPNGLITSTSDAQGKTLESHGYDSGRRGLTSQLANSVDSVGVSYNGAVATLTDSAGDATQYTAGTRIASRNFVTAVSGSGCDTCGGRRNYTFTYDAAGNRTSSTDPMGHVTNYSYDGNGNVLQKSIQMDSVPTYQIWKYTYNSFNEVLTATDPLGNVTTNTYDAKGNLLTTTTPSPASKVKGSVTTFTYDAKGELTKITDPLNHPTTIAYFPSGLVQSITDAQSKMTQFQYDARGNRTSLIDANNQQTTFAHDAMGRLTKITYPTTPVTFTQIGYDYRGRKVTVTDPNGKITQYVYDDADRLTSVTDANYGLTQYAYDNENNLTSILDAANHQTTFQYDQYGSLTQTTFPSSWTENYYYDPNGNLTSKLDRDGHTINYNYDFLNRLTSKQYTDSTSVTYSYDTANRLTRVVDPSGTYVFTYDNMSRLTQTSATYSFIPGKTFTVGSLYDATSNRTSMTDPQNASTAYMYDTLNRLGTLTYPSRTNYTFTYDPLGRRTQLTRPNSVNSTYQYDSLSRLLSVLHNKSTSTLDGASYAYDSSSNRTSKTDKRTNVTSTFSYDPLYELTQVAQGTNTTESYSYDIVGNRLSSLGVSPYSYNASNQLTSKPNVSYTYDNNGNTLTKVDPSGTTTYNWNFENRLTSTVLPGSGGTVSFKYDPFGRRIQKSSSAGTTNYVYDGANVLEEVDNSGTVLARYVHGPDVDAPLSETRLGTTSYYETDGLGSVTSLSNSSGALANTYTYDSFGKLIASTGTITNNYRYTGRDFDSETGLYYYRARYYDLSIGRFMSEDPIGFNGGINFYGYVHNDPADFRDPSGLLDVLIWNGGTSAGAGKPPYGHAAVLLDDGTYISWWPGMADDRSNPTTIFRDGPDHFARDARDPSYAADVQRDQEGEGRGPDVDIYINSLDEAAIKKWWNEFQKNPTWDSYNRNCSDTAMDALMAGGAGKLLKPKKNWYFPTSPGDVKDYAQDLQIYNNNSWDHGIKLTF